MKLRYYLRGLGIGIFVTAVIFCTLPGEKEALSDAEIRARALELGMVESSSLTLADVQNKQESEKPQAGEQQLSGGQEAIAGNGSGQAENKQETVPGEGSGAENQGNEGTEGQDTENVGTENNGSQDTAIQNSGTEATVTPDVHQQGTVKAEQESGSEVIKITVESGAHSYTVARKLEEMQLVEDAGDFDEYLCNNGYSRTIRVGTHKIPKGATWEEIAKIISGK